MIDNTKPYILTESIRYSRGIKQIQVDNTIKNIKDELLPVLRINDNDVAFIGSAGKKEDPDDKSYNINLAIDLKSLNKNNKIKDDSLKLIKEQIERMGYSSELHDDFISVEWPIEGDFSNSEIELIIQVTDNLNWVKFSRYSPNVAKEESNFIGKYREALLWAICDVSRTKIVSYFNPNGVIKEYEKFELDINKGLFVILMSFESRNGINKVSQKVEGSEKLYTDDPEEFINIVFNDDNLKIDDVSTFEECWELFMDNKFHLKKKRKRIIEKFKNKLIEYRLDIPRGIDDK